MVRSSGECHVQQAELLGTGGVCRGRPMWYEAGLHNRRCAIRDPWPSEKLDAGPGLRVGHSEGVGRRDPSAERSAITRRLFRAGIRIRLCDLGHVGHPLSIRSN